MTTLLCFVNFMTVSYHLHFLFQDTRKDKQDACIIHKMARHRGEVVSPNTKLVAINQCD